MKFFSPFILLLFMIPAFAFPQIKMMIDTENAELDKVNAVKDNGMKKITIYRYDYDEVDFQQDSSVAEIMTYDAEKMLFTDINYTPAYSKSILSLNPQNKILYREIYDEKNNITGKTEFYYREDGLTDRREIFLGASKAFDEVYSYEGGALKKMKYVTADGVLFGYSEFESDQWGNIIQEIKYNSNDETDYKYLYTYDANSRCLEEKIILGNKKTTLVSYIWKNGLLDEKTVKEENGKTLGSTKFTYNSNGKVVEEINDSPQGKITKLYEYDGNLVRQVKISDLSDVSSYMLRYFYE